MGKRFNPHVEYTKSAERAVFPDCGDPKVLNTIIKCYNWAEDHTWRRGIELDDINRARERLTLAGGDRLVNRRFCRGHATFPMDVTRSCIT